MTLRIQSAIEHRALEIKRSLGIRRAAGYLRNRGVSVEVARKILL